MVDAEVMQLDLGVRPRQRRRAIERRRIVVLVGEPEDVLARCRQPPSRTRPAPSAPAATRTRTRRLAIGSSTAPVKLVSGRPSVTATGAWTLPPRPMKRARSVSNSMPSRRRSRRHASRPAHGRCAARGRRANTRPDTCGMNSLRTKRFENAGCARSAAGCVNVISAYDVISISVPAARRCAASSAEFPRRPRRRRSFPASLRSLHPGARSGRDPR